MLAGLTAAGTLVVASAAPAQQGNAPANRFEKNVVAYEEAGHVNPPPKGAILLAGDSQFYRWTTLHEHLPGCTVVNRGIDSFQTSDLVQYTERLVLPHEPRLIVLHVGGNDVNNGKSPEPGVRIEHAPRHEPRGRGARLTRLRDELGCRAFKIRLGTPGGRDRDAAPGRTRPHPRGAPGSGAGRGALRRREQLLHAGRGDPDGAQTFKSDSQGCLGCARLALIRCGKNALAALLAR